MLANAFRSTAKRTRRHATQGHLGAVLMLLGLLGLPGCSPEPVGGEAAPLPPQGVLGKEEFVRVMTEVQLIEAVADKRIYRNDNERQRLAEAYNDVWARTGVSAATFDSSYTWWWGHPEAMKSVLRDVVDALKDMEVESNRGDAAGAEGNLKNRVAGGTPAPSTE